MKIPMPEEKKKEKETQEIVWEIPVFDSHSVLQKKMLQKKMLCQHTKGKHDFQLLMSYFLPKSALSLSFLFLCTLCFSWTISTKPVSHSICYLFPTKKEGNKKTSLSGKERPVLAGIYQQKSEFVHLVIQKVLICHHVMYRIRLLYQCYPFLFLEGSSFQ